MIGPKILKLCEVKIAILQTSIIGVIDVSVTIM